MEAAQQKTMQNKSDHIIIELKLPVPTKELDAVIGAIGKIHGEETLFLRQVGMMLQIHKQRASATVAESADSNDQTMRWIQNAARELAMDSAHISAIAKIIKRHASTDINL